MILQTMLLLVLLQGAPAPEPAYFASASTAADMAGKQAVMETSMGTIVMQLLPEVAPTHVAHFLTLAREGAYEGTIFHHVIPRGMIQGGDPITRDPARSAEYGTGGMKRLRAEARDPSPAAGSVVAALLPGDPDSAGSQFFICIGAQPGLGGQYTVFARVVEGLEIVEAIAAVPAGPEGRPLDRVEITSIAIRDTPPEPFVDETDAELAGYKAVVETTLGTFELDMLPDKAPITVRRFLRMVQAGVYDGIAVHRIASNFVIQTGALFHRREPLRDSQQRLVQDLPPEFTDTPNVPGIVSMARGSDPGSGSTSFFVCIGECRALDGQYTVFARVSAGTDVIARIAAAPVDGETPVTPIVMTRVTAVPR